MFIMVTSKEVSSSMHNVNNCGYVVKDMDFFWLSIKLDYGKSFAIEIL